MDRHGSSYTILLSIKIAQCFLALILFITFVLFAHLLFCTPVYHRNLSLLLVSIVFQHVMTVTPYAYLDIQWTLGFRNSFFDEIFLFIHNTGSYLIVFNVPIIVLERLYSFIYVDKYEHMNATVPWLSVALITFQVLWATSFQVITITNILSPIAVFSLSFGSFTLGNLLFALVPIFAKKAFLDIRKDGGSISKRYQSVENLKASKMLMRLSLFIIFSSVVEYVFMFINVFIFDDDDNAISSSILILIWELDFHITIGIVIHSHRSLKQKFHGCLPVCCNRFFRPSKISNVVKSTDGKQLVFNVEDHKKLYFKAYETMWK